MFEKEAEERTLQQPCSKDHYYYGFKDGAEFGYNKGKNEAKEIIKELLNSCFGYNSKTVNYEVKAKAEQFIKEE